MKYSIIFLVVGLTCLSQYPAMAQNSNEIEAEIGVEGVCKMCKERIENAAYSKGVKFTEWNKETQTLKVVYNSSKTSLETIHQQIAAEGHSTNLYPADSTAYTKLPACCAYQDGVEVH